MNRGKFYFFIFIAVILGMVTLQLQLHQRLDRHVTSEQASSPTLESLIKTEPPKPVVVEKTLAQKKLDESVTLEFINQLKQESEHYGRPQKNVEELENRLQSWARHLDEREIDYLAAIVKDRTRGEDERSLALDLLGRNQSSQSLAQLKEFVLTKDVGFKDARSRLDEELIFKVQAVEEIAASSSSAEAISYLTEIHKKTEQSFVRDRAQRSLTSLKGLTPAAEAQDPEALKKMIE